MASDPPGTDQPEPGQPVPGPPTPPSEGHRPAPPGPTPTGTPTTPGDVPAAGAWYNGPLPIAELMPRETIGSAIGRTAVKAVTAVVIVGAGLIAVPVLLVIVIASIGGVLGGGLETPGTPTTLVAGEPDADLRLVAVPITGLILGEDRGAGGGGLFSPLDVTYGYTVKDELAKLADDDSVDGVILELDSPGGTIFGSRAIADGVADYRAETNKPVVAYVSGISASGGMYAMAGADVIYADHGTLIGSIGVIFGPFSRYKNVTAIDGGILGGGITTENGIEVDYLTAGRSKDLGNPYRPMTDEERSILQDGLDDAYAEFVAHVSAGRDLPQADIEKGLGALIFGEQQALANGLIDGVSNRDDSYRLAAEAAGLRSGQTWKVERLDTGAPGILGLFTGSLGGGASGDGDGDPGQTTRIEPLCLGSGAILAYHGDPAMLCTGGR